MRSLRYQFSIPNYLRVRAADRLPLPLLASGKIPGLSEISSEPRPLPGPDWIRLAPRLCGVCGSDISMLTNRSGPALSPFISFPLTPGHEVVADVTEAGAGAGPIALGQRVVVNPLISCEMRGLPLCVWCRRGEPGLCTNSAEGSLSPGMLAGFCKDVPGGWSEEMIVHRSQVFAIPDSFSDRTAVLIEPLSVAVHAVLKSPPPPDAKVLVIGSGTIGLLVLSALRLLGHECDVTILARHPIQRTMATKLGATRVLRDAGDAAITVAGARSYRPIKGKPAYAGGFDWVFDCAGSARSVDDAFRVAGPRAQVVMVGCAAELAHIDFSFVWARELHISGCYVYGREHALEDQPHTFEITMKLLADHPELPLEEIVTHVIPLANWREAMRLSLQRGRSGAIKVAFDCRAGSAR